MPKGPEEVIQESIATLTELKDAIQTSGEGASLLDPSKGLNFIEILVSAIGG